jgi:hypothetical protein
MFFIAKVIFNDLLAMVIRAIKESRINSKKYLIGSQVVDSKI